MNHRTLADLSPTELRRVWEHLDIGIAFVDRSGKFLSANPAYCELTERSEYELQKLTFQEITSPEDQEADSAQSEEVAAGQRERFEMRKTYIGKFTPRIPVILSVMAIHDHDGDFQMFLSQAREEHAFDQQPWRDLVDGIRTFNNRLDAELPVTATEARLGMMIAQNVWKILFGAVAFLGAFAGMIFAIMN